MAARGGCGLGRRVARGATRHAVGSRLPICFWKLQTPPMPKKGTAVLRAVMFTDVVGSTELAREMGDVRWSRLLAAQRRVIRAELKAAGGHARSTRRVMASLRSSTARRMPSGARSLPARKSKTSVWMSAPARHLRRGRDLSGGSTRDRRAYRCSNDGHGRRGRGGDHAHGEGPRRRVAFRPQGARRA